MSSTIKKNGAINALIILHRAMLMGLVIFAAVAFFVVYSLAFSKGLQFPEQTLQVLALILSAIGFYGGNALFKRKLSAIRQQTDIGVKERFVLYQSACIIQWVLIEAPALFVIICFLLTGNYAFLGLAGMLVLILAMLAPSKMKLVLHLQLSDKDLEEL